MKITDLTIADLVMTLVKKGDEQSLAAANTAMRLADDLVWQAHWATPNHPIEVFEECMPNLGERPEDNPPLMQKLWKKIDLQMRLAREELEQPAHLEGYKYVLRPKGDNAPRQAIYVPEAFCLIEKAQVPTDGYVLTWRDHYGTFQRQLTHRLHSVVRLPASWHGLRSLYR